MWLYILIVAVIIYALYKERQALGCGSILEEKDCDNANGKAVKGSLSSASDSTPEILDKIEFAADYQSRFVKWRSFLMLSFIGTVVLWFVIFGKFPTEWELVCGIIVLFLMSIAVDGFYTFHLYKYIQNNINGSIKILKDRDGNSTSPQSIPYT